MGKDGLLYLCGGVLLFLVVLTLFHLAREAPDEPSATASQATQRATSTAAEAAESDENHLLCLQFMGLVNAHDAGAAKLLDATPTIPAEPVTPAEADRLDAEIVLHQPSLHVLGVRREKDTSPQGARFVLVLEGSVTSEHLRVQTPTGSETRQRVMWSPDLLVEVRDGQIHGLAARLHED